MYVEIKELGGGLTTQLLNGIHSKISEVGRLRMQLIREHNRAKRAMLRMQKRRAEVKNGGAEGDAPTTCMLRAAEINYTTAKHRLSKCQRAIADLALARNTAEMYLRAALEKHERISDALRTDPGVVVCGSHAPDTGYLCTPDDLGPVA